MKKLSALIAAPGGLLLLVFFFLPWISVSCAGTDIIQASGYDLAQGLDEDNLGGDIEAMMSDITNEMMSEAFAAEGGMEFNLADDPAFDFSDPAFSGGGDLALAEGAGGALGGDSDAKLYLIPLIGLLTFALAGMGFFEPRLLNMFTGLGVLLIPAIIGLVLLAFKYVDLQGEINDTNQQAEDSFSLVKLNLLYGYWMSALSLLAIAAAGAMVFLDTEQSATAPADLLSGIQQSAPESPSGLAGFGTSQPQVDVKQQFAAARELIQAKRYDEARQLLNSIDHPTAAEWLQKLDDIASR